MRMHIAATSVDTSTCSEFNGGTPRVDRAVQTLSLGEGPTVVEERADCGDLVVAQHDDSKRHGELLELAFDVPCGGDTAPLARQWFRAV